MSHRATRSGADAALAIAAQVVAAITLALIAVGCGAVGGPRSGELVFDLGGGDVDGGPDAGDAGVPLDATGDPAATASPSDAERR